MFLSILAGCSNSGPSDTEKGPSSSRHTPAGGELRIAIRLGGDDLASKQDLEMRGRIESLIEERDVGEIVRAGTGMGWMDIWVRTKDKGKARRAVEAIIKEVDPQSKFSVE
jgi:hypothetical protein